ncbi:hypothetical protein Tco_0715902 [Tanacetum coccineum]
MVHGSGCSLSFFGFVMSSSGDSSSRILPDSFELTTVALSIDTLSNDPSARSLMHLGDGKLGLMSAFFGPCSQPVGAHFVTRKFLPAFRRSLYSRSLNIPSRLVQLCLWNALSTIVDMLTWYPLYCIQEAFERIPQRDFHLPVYFCVTNFSTSSWITLFLFGACPLFFCLTGEYPSRIFKRCSAMFRGMPVIISWASRRNIQVFVCAMDHSLCDPFSVNVDPYGTVCSGYSGWLLYLFSLSTWVLLREAAMLVGDNNTFHMGMTLLLCNVTVPPSTGNFNIPCAVDGTARIFLIPGLPIIALCWDGGFLINREVNPCGGWSVLHRLF